MSPTAAIAIQNIQGETKGTQKKNIQQASSNIRHTGRQKIKERRQVKGNIRKAGHHQPDWETNEGRQVNTDSQRDPDTTRQIKEDK